MSIEYGKWNDTTARHEGPPPGASISGQKLGDFVVGALIGAGGMGEVYAGEQPMIGKKVAIKVLKAQIAADPENVRRMLSEARSVNAIRHRGIVDIFNFGSLPDGRPYLVMEYLEGASLESILRKRKVLTPVEVAEFIEEICSALSAAHAKGIVHRDLKPGNVFIVTDSSTRARYVKLLDFGLAKAAELPIAGGARTRVGTILGTPDYISPEQAKAGEVTAQSDLYSLGVMAFQMLTGAVPFTAPSITELIYAHVSQPAPHISERVEGIPPALDALVFRLMAKRPEDRPQSADEVGRDLSRMHRAFRERSTVTFEDLGAQLARASPPSPKPRRQRSTEIAIPPMGQPNLKSATEVASSRAVIASPGTSRWKLAMVGALAVAVLIAVLGWFLTRAAP